MADILRDTDLIMVNRGGVNYKLSGAELKQHDRLQDTDLVMVQESGQLYSVSIGALKTAAGSLIDGPTNFFLAERDNQLFAVENPFRRIVMPMFVCGVDTSGLSSISTTGIKITVTGGVALDGVRPHYVGLKADNTPALIGGDLVGSTSSSISKGDLDQYEVAKIIVVGQYASIKFSDSKALTTVKWVGGDNGWNRMFASPAPTNGQRMFEFCTKLTHVFGMSGYGGAPPAGILQSLQQTFYSCALFDGDISSWDTSQVTSMYGTFDTAALFNKDISSWNTENVTTMKAMFSSAAAFDKPLNSWDVGKVIEFNNMFYKADSFNQPLNNWVQSGDAITTVKESSGALDSMFQLATNFNQDLTGWCVSNFGAVPSAFGRDSGLNPGNYPVWGTCP